MYKCGITSQLKSTILYITLGSQNIDLLNTITIHSVHARYGMTGESESLEQWSDLQS